MYRIEEIVNSFKPLVGWEDDSPSHKIDRETSASESGLYFQDVHPLLTLRAMNGIMPTDLLERYSAYKDTRTYSKGEIVRGYDKAWKSLIDNNLGHPLSDDDAWEEHTILSEYLDSLEAKGIKKVITRFVRDKVVGMETKNLIDRRCLFDGTGRIEQRTKPNGKVCGFEITPVRAGSVVTILERIGLQFIGNTGDITLYLFHSSKREPIWTKTVSYSKTNGTFMWYDVNVSIPYISDDTNAGGSWYLVYDQNALPSYMESINFGRDWSREPCGTCNKGDIQLYRLMTKYATFSPFYVSIDGEWDGKLWDIQDNIYTNVNNYGINIMFSMCCDITSTIIAERNMFANAIQLQVASDALRALALNPEVNVNRVQANADRDNVLYETDGNGQGIKGLNGELEKAYKALSFDTKGLDEVCLTCKTKGIRIGAI